VLRDPGTPKPGASTSRNDLEAKLGEHCEVTACSSTTPRFCVEAAGASMRRETTTGPLVVEKLTDTQCMQVVAVMRSLRE
jgi:hypothetical protein